ncbi:energy transducer TonB [Sphingomonas sp.]|uniref:energy transducer TonB n=1 Tax=Sphingomonas sp. TaxID=28214 RepID=UPI003CC61788
MLALIATAQAATGAPARQAPNMRPVPIGNPGDWFSPDDYPPEAQRSSRQGRVVVEVGVDSIGNVETCNIVQSSGTAVLDTRTCALAVQHGRFDPATDRRGRPVGASYLLPVRWVLPEGSPPTLDAAHAADYDGDLTIEYVVVGEGKLASCRVLAGRRAPAVTADPCPARRIGQPFSAPWQRDGHPVRVRIVRRETQTVSVAP